MDAATAAAMLLGSVFVASGSAKVFSPSWPAQAEAIGAPVPVARTLPWLEVALGSMALAGVARPAMSAVMGLLLVVFSLALVRVLLAGHRPPCACFGRFSRRPVGWKTVARNLVLLLIAVVAISH